MVVIQSANLALRFLLELCALVALGYWGFKTGSGTITKLALGVGVPLLAAAVWGAALSPRRSVPLSDRLAFILSLVVLGLSAVAVGAAGQATLAVVFAVLTIVNATLIVLWKQWRSSSVDQLGLRAENEGP